MTRYSLRRFGISSAEVDAIAEGLRRHTVPATAAVGDVREGGPFSRWLDRIRGRRDGVTNEVGRTRSASPKGPATESASACSTPCPRA